MAQIIIENLFRKTVTFQDHTKSLLQHLHDNGIDWMHACGGKGRCTSCKAIILLGDGNLDPPTAAEQRFSRLGALRANERLGCQVRIRGDVTISVPEEGKLPHLKYSD